MLTNTSKGGILNISKEKEIKKMEQVLAMVMAMVEELHLVEDVEVDVYGGAIHLTVRDFIGFDEHWDEIFRDYDEDGVDQLLEWLEVECESYTEDFYSDYRFGDVTVWVGYESYDI